MSICIISACWQRPEVTAAFIRHHQSLTPAPAGIIMAGSPADGHQMVDFAGVNYFRVPNVLAAKWNAAVLAAREVDADHYLFMGSDDFMDQAMWTHYSAFMGHHLSLLDLYFHHAASDATLYWPGYVGPRRGEPIGAAKLVRRDVLDLIDWQPFTERRNAALDYDMHRKIRGAGATIDVVRMEATGGICVDLKGSISATPWKVITRQPKVEMMPDGWMRREHTALHAAMCPPTATGAGTPAAAS